MDINVTSPSDEFAIMHLRGKFTLEHIQSFKDRTSQIVKNALSTIFVDFSEVSYIDSSGIGVLIMFMNSMKNRNINFILYDLNKDVFNLFRIAYLDKFFNISTSTDLKNRYPEIKF